MSRNTTYLLLFLFLFAFCLSANGVYAFGAGNIPSFAYMEGRAFRHGDIEDALADLIKKGAGSGFALASILSKGSKFNGLDIKRVYFGNWLRDYSQAIDIASLKKVQLQTILTLCMALGFMAHGYATNEFEVTEERLGVYLPTEHIDNPKGYGDGEDARKYHPKLRGPVDPRELDIDPRTGMKNYIGNEQGGWDTSKALVRRTLEKCIHFGRQHRANGRKQDEYEAYRLLGQALHTLEDYSAHSNFCELSLITMGHSEVFTHVGDQVRVQAPNGKWVAPIVTGTFGSDDFTHSLLGEAGDHLSQASVSDLNKELDKARSTSQAQSTRGGPGGGPTGPADVLRGLFTSLPGSDGNEMSRELDAVERIRAGPAQGGKRPEDMSPQELHATLWQVLVFRDSVVKKISKTIEKIPGLGPMIEKLMDSISVFVFTTIEPFLKPILKTATSGLQSASGEVINSHDQYEVFNDPRASDPTHSFLSKDHFNLILNEPAGQIARVIVVNTVNLVIKAWDDNSLNAHQSIEEILQCLFHPDFHNSNSKVQREMLACMREWTQKLGNKQRATLNRLTKNAVRNHENIRLAGEGGPPAAQGTFAESQAHQFQNTLQGYVSQVPVLGQAQSFFNSGPTRATPDASSGYPGTGSGKPYQGPSPPPPSMGGSASSYYSDTKPPAGASSYPSGPPSFPGGPSSYASPSGPPPLPSYPSSAPSVPHQSGYAPSYAPSYNPPAPSFPGEAPSFPGPPRSFPNPPPTFPGVSGPSGGYQPSYQPSYAPPSFPPAPEHGGHGGYQPAYAPGFPGTTGGFAPPPGPGFPGADTSGGFAAPGFPPGPGQHPYGGQGYSGGR